MLVYQLFGSSCSASTSPRLAHLLELTTRQNFSCGRLFIIYPSSYITLIYIYIYIHTYTYTYMCIYSLMPSRSHRSFHNARAYSRRRSASTSPPEAESAVKISESRIRSNTFQIYYFTISDFSFHIKPLYISLSIYVYIYIYTLY